MWSWKKKYYLIFHISAWFSSSEWLEEEEITQKYHFTRDIAIARVSALVHINVLTVLTLHKQLSHLEDYYTRKWDE